LVHSENKYKVPSISGQDENQKKGKISMVPDYWQACCSWFQPRDIFKDTAGITPRWAARRNGELIATHG
jgi:hypothetical protein